MKRSFNLTKEEREEMVTHIQAYYEKEHGDQIGNLAAMMILDFFIGKLAPYFYNLGVKDSHAYMSMKIDDLFEIEK